MRRRVDLLAAVYLGPARQEVEVTETVDQRVRQTRAQDSACRRMRELDSR